MDFISFHSLHIYIFLQKLFFSFLLLKMPFLHAQNELSLRQLK